MENETDVIRNQMLETRTSLTEKLEALEEKVVSTVQDTTESVTETVQSVTEAVQDTVSNVSESVQDTVESVKSTFDISKHVESYPWAMFGGAVMLGYLGGRMLPMPSTGTLAQAATTVAGAVSSAASNVGQGLTSSGPSHTSSSPSYSSTSGPSYGSSSPSYSSSSSPTSTSSANGLGSDWTSGLADALSPVVSQLEGLAISAVTGLLGKMVLSSTPENFQPQIKEFIDQVTTTLGGTPLEKLAQQSSHSSPGSHSSSGSMGQHRTV